MEIDSKLRDLKRYVNQLAEYRKRSVGDIKDDLTLRGALERYLQLSIEIVIETGEMIIARKGFTKPETYREVMEILGKEGVIDKRLAGRLSKAAGLRNILIHRYGDIDVEELHEFLRKDIGDFDEFARQISDFLVKEGRA